MALAPTIRIGFQCNVGKAEKEVEFVQSTKVGGQGVRWDIWTVGKIKDISFWGEFC